jgi:hypothetical protein
MTSITNTASTFFLRADVTALSDPTMRIHLYLNIHNSLYLSLDEAKMLHTRLDLALREAYDDIEVRNESA